MKKRTMLALVLALSIVAEVATADFTFGEPTKVPDFDSVLGDGRPQISRDGLQLYFTSHRERIEGESYLDIWFSERPTTKDSSKGLEPSTFGNYESQASPPVRFSAIISRAIRHNILD